MAETSKAEISHGLVIDQGTVLLVGTALDAPPALANAHAEGGEIIGRWRATEGRREADGRHGFVAIVTGADMIRRLHQPVSVVGVSEEKCGELALTEIAHIELDVAPILRAINGLALDPAEIFAFLRDTLSAEASARQQAFLVAYLATMSVHDGFVEIVGRTEDGGLFLQGWSVHLQAGAVEAGLLTANGLTMQAAAVATFERPDLLKNARGVVLYAGGADEAQGALQRIFFRGPQGYFGLEILPQPTVFDAAATVAHLKDMLPRLCGGAMVSAFRRLCQPVFAGEETVTRLHRPVRLACDVAVHAADGGLFLSGWMLDPTAQAGMVLLRSTAGFAHRIDTDWVRLPRQDVHDGYAADPVFTHVLQGGSARHGFACFVRRPGAPAEGERFFIEVVLKDESGGYLPLDLQTGDLRALCRRMLGQISLDDPASERLIEDHIAPFVGKAWAASPAQRAEEHEVFFGLPCDAPLASLLVPMPSGYGGFDVFLACLANEPECRRIELVVVTPSAQAGPAIAALKRAAAFYGVGGRVIAVPDLEDEWEAYALAAARARAGSVVAIAPSIVPKQRGWLGVLLAELAARGPRAVISPTLLYEDESIRYAGQDSDQAPLAGYARDWIAAHGPQRAATPSLHCFATGRATFARLRGEGGGFIHPEFRRRESVRRYAGNGVEAVWLPDVALYAPDEPLPSHDDYWLRVGRKVDLANSGRVASPAQAFAPGLAFLRSES